MLGSGVGFKDSAGVQSGQNFPLGGFGAHAAAGAFGAHGLLRAAPLATNCWPEAPRGGGRGSWRPRTRGVAPPPPGLNTTGARCACGACRSPYIKLSPHAIMDHHGPHGEQGMMRAGVGRDSQGVTEVTRSVDWAPAKGSRTGEHPHAHATARLQYASPAMERQVPTWNHLRRPLPPPPLPAIYPLLSGRFPPSGGGGQS